MRIAVLSDIHANNAALRAVLHDVDTQVVDAVWCLGDIVGRGFEPVDVAVKMRRLMKKQPDHIPSVWLVGNHEYMILGRIEPGFLEDTLPISGDNMDAVRMADENRRELASRPELLNWLSSLPTYAQPFPGVYIAHAAYMLDEKGHVDVKRSYREYLLGDAAISRQITSLQKAADPAPRLIMTAHTHISSLWTMSRDEAEPHAIKAHMTEQHTFDLNKSIVYANPGSVGFPRKPDVCPTYLILETADNFASLQVEFRNVRYDGHAVIIPKNYPDVYRKEIQKCTLR